MAVREGLLQEFLGRILAILVSNASIFNGNLSSTLPQVVFVIMLVSVIVFNTVIDCYCAGKLPEIAKILTELTGQTFDRAGVDQQVKKLHTKRFL